MVLTEWFEYIWKSTREFEQHSLSDVLHQNVSDFSNFIIWCIIGLFICNLLDFFHEILFDGVNY